MGKLEKDKDGNPVIVVPFHIRHLGPRQSIVLDCGSKFNDVVNEPLPKSEIRPFPCGTDTVTGQPCSRHCHGSNERQSP